MIGNFVPEWIDGGAAELTAEFAADIAASP